MAASCGGCGRRSESFSSANSGMARNRTMGLRRVLNRDIDNLKSRIARGRWCVSHDPFQGCRRITKDDGAPLSKVSRYAYRPHRRQGYADRSFTARMRSKDCRCTVSRASPPADRAARVAIAARGRHSLRVALPLMSRAAAGSSRPGSSPPAPPAMPSPIAQTEIAAPSAATRAKG